MTSQRPTHLLKSRRSLAYGLLWLGWGILAYLASSQPTLPGDLKTTLWLQSFRSAPMDTLMMGISVLGDPVSIIIEVALIALILWFIGRRRHILLVLLTPVIVGVGDGLQWIINRPRPPTEMVEQLVELRGGSFPSGHVVWATALAICLLFVVELRWHLRLRVALWVFLLVFATLTGLSRMYLGAHWLSDVIGGYVFGTLAIIGVYALYHRWIKRRISVSEVK